VQQWQDEHLHHESYNNAKVWPNIPNIVYSVHTSIVQQLITTKVYSAKKVQVEEKICYAVSATSSRKETVPRIMCSCSAITQTLYSARHDRMLRSVYYAILRTLGITNKEEDETITWYRELQPKCCVETKEVKVLWNIPLYLDVVPKDVDGANKPDIALCNKKERHWLIFQGTVCNIGQIQERDKLKTEKYADLRASCIPVIMLFKLI